MRLVAACLVPVVCLGVLEIGLRLAGYGYPTSFWLLQGGGQTCVENDKFLWQFYSPKTLLAPNPFCLAFAKPTNTVRIFLLGESAAAGTPDPAYGFGRILERMLSDQFPQRRIELINAAMRGVNSHIILPVARDCARLEPDLFIVYMGNNEVVGLHAPGPRSGGLTRHLRLLRALQWLRSSRLGQLLTALGASWGRPAVSEEGQDAAFFREHRLAADDPRREAVSRAFRANLMDVCEAAQQAGAKVVLATVAVNLKDCPPLGSLHRRDLAAPELARWEAACQAGDEAEAKGQFDSALAHYQAAAAVDDHYADLHFRLARTYAALERWDKAREHFNLARDWDALQFRADRRLNGIVIELAKSGRGQGCHLVDAAKALADGNLSEHQLPGEKLFYDHVHFTFDGDYLMARALLPAVGEALRKRLGPPATNAPLLSRDECAARLGYTRLGEAMIAGAMARLTAQPPFTEQLDHAQRQLRVGQMLTNRFGDLRQQDIDRAKESCLRAIHQAPADWRLTFNLGRLLYKARDYPGAIGQFRRASEQLPHYLPIRLALSSALAGAGRFDEALALLAEARRLDPRSDQIRVVMAQLRARQRGQAQRRLPAEPRTRAGD